MRGLPWLVASNAANSVFAYLTVFGAVFVLFLSKLGIPNGRIGLIMSIMPFCGLLAIVSAPFAARNGLKKTYITFWGLRKFATAAIILTPWVLNRWNTDAATLYVAICVLIFAVCRSLGETAFLPWTQEIVPDNIRGRFTALNNAVCNIFSIATVVAAGFYIRSEAGLTEFMVLMGVGVVFGFVCVWLAVFVPGGAPIRASASGVGRIREMGEPLRDPVFRSYLFGVGLLALAGGVATFLPLFLKEVLGVAPGFILFVTVAGTTGALSSSYFWGWAVDRYGAKPVVTWSLIVASLVPLLWMMIPAGTASTGLMALALMFAASAFQSGWSCADSRMLFVDIVPPTKGTHYLAVYYAWLGLFGGLGPLLAGQVTQMAGNTHSQFYLLGISSYTPFFLAACVLTASAVWVLRRIVGSGETSAMKFAGLFVRGNVLAAADTLMRFRLPSDERSRATVTERMGVSRSPLTIQELIWALGDPSFSVRYEAIVAMSRMERDPRLTAALIDVLNGSQRDIALVAAWALGKTGGNSAVKALRQSLDQGFPMLQAASARALGRLRDREETPTLLTRLRAGGDDHVLVGYASALGALGVEESLPDTLMLLERLENSSERAELALGVARIMGDEREFVRLWRDALADPGTAVSQELFDLRKCADRFEHHKDDVEALIDEVVELLSSDFDAGARALAGLALLAADYRTNDAGRTVLTECARQLEQSPARLEYVVLAVRAMCAE